eukprot:1711227-Amphidinium_carterae.1
MRSPSASKMRLTFEELDMAITSTALEDICSLFGRVLDCKVEKDEELTTKSMQNRMPVTQNSNDASAA